MRRVMYVPVLHTAHEIRGVHKRGERLNHHFRRSWQRIRTEILRDVLRSKIDLRNVLIFCDSVPYPLSWSYRQRILRSRNFTVPMYRLVQFLWRRGARLCGTEDPVLSKFELLYEEYCLLKGRRDYTLERDLLDARDHFIARNIAATLRHDQMAIILMGMAHQVDRKLRRIAPDIVVARVECFKRPRSARA